MSLRTVDDAAAQLKRLLVALPTLGDERAHAISEVAELAGASEEVLLRDLRTLVTRFDDGPGGFVEGVRLAFGTDTVQLESKLFKRPMGLAPDEIGALELGLAVLERELPPHEAGVARLARERLSAIASDEEIRQQEYRHAGQFVGSLTEGAAIAEIRDALAAVKKVAIVYRSAENPDGGSRSVHSFELVYSRSKWFLIGFCERSNGVRIFRVDRIVSVTVSNEPSKLRDPTETRIGPMGGTGFLTKADEQLEVTYSPSIARWVAEKDGQTVLEDGSITVAYPLLDDQWALRFVLQYGPEAEIRSPARMRHVLSESLKAGI